LKKVNSIEDLVSREVLDKGFKNEKSKEIELLDGFFESCETIGCNNTELFIEHLAHSLGNNYPTFAYIDGKKLRIGFISLRNDKNVLVTVRVGSIKRYLVSKEQEAV
jgi:hypothetical protein